MGRISTSQVRDGDKIVVTIAGDVVGGQRFEHNSCTKVRDEAGNYHWIYFNSYEDSDGVQVERADPDYMPIKAGDVFATSDGKRWMARTPDVIVKMYEANTFGNTTVGDFAIKYPTASKIA